MSLTTYLGLKDSIEAWSHRNDVASRLDDFIDLAESEMLKWIRIRDMETRATAVTSGRYLSLPSDFLEMRRLRMISGAQYFEVLSSTPEGMYITQDSGMPKLFTVTSQVEFDRTPDSAYIVEMQYYGKPTALSATNTTNSILTKYPNIYLFGSLWALYLWALQEDKAEYYYGKLMQAIQTANREDKKGRHGPAPAMRYGGPTP
ncbi:MAG: hypothetical protein ING20_11290 [Burkholderiales bacterium]|nr:hypothetical protein [Burkholderiales bacterium]